MFEISDVYVILQKEQVHDMETIKIKDEFIKLGQALKLAGMVESGVEAKIVVQDGLVSVNGEIDTRRGRKLYKGDEFSFEGKTARIDSDF